MLNLFDELLEYNDTISDSIMKIAFTKPFDTLWIDVPTQQIFSGADEIIVDEDK